MPDFSYLTIHESAELLRGRQVDGVVLASAPGAGNTDIIQQLADVYWSGGVLNAKEPAQSITLYILPPSKHRR